MLGLYWKSYLDYWRPKTIIATETVFSSGGKGFGLNY
jgi:hypothetical protein